MIAERKIIGDRLHRNYIKIISMQENSIEHISEIPWGCYSIPHYANIQKSKFPLYTHAQTVVAYIHPIFFPFATTDHGKLLLKIEIVCTLVWAAKRYVKFSVHTQKHVTFGGMDLTNTPSNASGYNKFKD